MEGVVLFLDAARLRVVATRVYDKCNALLPGDAQIQKLVLCGRVPFEEILHKVGELGPGEAGSQGHHCVVVSIHCRDAAFPADFLVNGAQHFLAPLIALSSRFSRSHVASGVKVPGLRVGFPGPHCELIRWRRQRRSCIANLLNYSPSQFHLIPGQAPPEYSILICRGPSECAAFARERPAAEWWASRVWRAQSRRRGHAAAA